MFFSPIAWLLLIVFVVQSGSTLIGTFSGYGVGMETGYSLSENILRWLLRNIQDYIYLYVPLLTMGLMSEELSTKTINLLYSSPIANRQIVMGKYLAMMGYGLLLCAVLLVDVVLVACGVPHFEWGVGLVGVLGVYLLFCTYASIGLFMSSLISYQLIAAIGTFAVFAILDIVGPFGRDIPILRDVTYWLDISSRAEDFSSGLLTTEGVLYYVVMSGLFIVLTIFRLSAVRQKIPFAHVVWKNLAAIVVACLIGYFSAQPGWIGYWDTTTRKINTLHPVGQEVLANIPENATMTNYAKVLYNYYWSA